MSERSIVETTTTEFSFDDSNEQLRKKIKLQNQKIIEKVKEINEEIDINEHEVQKFLLIFHSLFEIVTSEQAIEETDGFLNDTILTVVKIIADLLKNNIENLKLPAVLKTALKKLKSLFTKIKAEETVKTEEISNAREKGTEHSIQTSETSSTCREGREEQ